MKVLENEGAKISFSTKDSSLKQRSFFDFDLNFDFDLKKSIFAL